MTAPPHCKGICLYLAMFLGGLWTNEGFVSVGRDRVGWEGTLSQFDAVWTVDLAQLAGDRREGCVTSGAAGCGVGS